MKERVVIVENIDNSLTHKVIDGKHQLVVDEPASLGGNDEGPNPYGYLLAALGACTAITLRMYAIRKDLQITTVRVTLSHQKTNISDNNAGGLVDVFSRDIYLEGQLTREQRDKMLLIANKCPVHRTLSHSSRIETTLL